MKQTDFRLGNLIMYDRVVNKIASLNTSFDTLDIETPQGNIIHTRLEFIKPIELTEEWVKKLGFVYEGGLGYRSTDNTAYWHFSLGNNFIPKIWYRNAITSDNYKGCQFVHELQNLYYFMFRDELKIVST